VIPSPSGTRLPAWAAKKRGILHEARPLRRVLRDLGVRTVCEEARCPNIGECWHHGTATFMILGDTCTRRCGFCNVKTGRPTWNDPLEPARVARTIARMGLRHAVITSVDRDDLPDGGATHFAEVIRAIRAETPACAVEVLTPDFKKKSGALDTVLDAGPAVFAHNVETVPRLYKLARPGSNYRGSVGLLAEAARRRDRDRDGLRVKSSIIVGMGEDDGEVLGVMRDLREAGVDVVTLGQYLQPTASHLPVARYAHPDIFASFREAGMAMGFLHVESGPLVRSSYHAERHRPDPGAQRVAGAGSSGEGR
jgi:lipoic acid synthetase